uniref:Uncharacterized protein n=1 Tax=Ananas comosus var. bracteatus TaxID=296719 RepID=A0A6V7NP77_ANACO|nr:unnamed protein product [Ananas comosus var. bracteatus]
MGPRKRGSTPATGNRSGGGARRGNARAPRGASGWKLEWIKGSQIGGTGTMECDVSPYDDEFADHVSIPSPSRCIEDPLTDVADIRVSSFNEASPTRQEDKGAEDEGGSKTKLQQKCLHWVKENGSVTFRPWKRLKELVWRPIWIQLAGSKSNIDPEDALSPYGDEVDYEFTPSPPEVKNTDENIDVRSDSGAGCSRNEIPIVAKSFLTDRIIDIVKTFDRRQFKSAQEEVSKYCQCLSALVFDTSELERRINPYSITQKSLKS